MPDGSMMRQAPWQLFDREGQRKYLSPAERARFKVAAEQAPLPVRAFALTLHYSGCRITEALELKHSQLDATEGLIVLRSLKKRREGVFRAVPAPPLLLDLLQAIEGPPGCSFWPWSRTTAWRTIKDLMTVAGIGGRQACPKGIRHGFGIAAAMAGVPPTLIQRWMGHARLETTGHYLNVLGAEERELAARLWRLEA